MGLRVNVGPGESRCRHPWEEQSYRKEHKSAQVAEQSHREFKVGDILAQWGIDGNNPMEIGGNGNRAEKRDNWQSNTHG